MNREEKESVGGAGEVGMERYWLLAPGDEFQLALVMGSGLPRTVSGQPASYFWKDVIAEGAYEHPTKKFGLIVDQVRLKGWAATGRKMIGAGVAIPINCDHSEAARDCVGYIKDFKVDGGRLMALCQFIGEEAAVLAARNQVSAGIVTNFVDGKGRKWGDAIVHVALTPAPVVPGQEGFVEVALRVEGEEVLMLARGDVKEKGAEQKREVVEVKSEAARVDAGVDAGALEAALELFDTKMEMAFARGGIDRVTKEKIRELLGRDGRGEINVMTLSRGRGVSGPARGLALALAEILMENKAVGSGEVTGMQAMVRVIPGEGDMGVMNDFNKYMTQVANRR